jgi:hypothetical protein
VGDADARRDAGGSEGSARGVPAGKRLRGYILPAVLTVLVIAAIAVALLLHS